MDSHVFKKAANRLPALADLAVLRFNTRGTSSERGTSAGRLRRRGGRAVRRGGGAGVRRIPRSAARLAGRLVVRHRTGAEVGPRPARRGRHPPLAAAAPGHDADLDAWAEFGRPLVALVPEFDDYLRPEEARRRFARVPQAEVIGVDGAKHLWVGEPYVRIVLDEIVRRVNPAAAPLPVDA